MKGLQGRAGQGRADARCGVADARERTADRDSELLLSIDDCDKSISNADVVLCIRSTDTAVEVDGMMDRGAVTQAACLCQSVSAKTDNSNHFACLSQDCL